MRKKEDFIEPVSNIKANSIDTMIGEETTIEGNLNLKGNIIIYGKIMGNIEATGSINVSPGAQVDGQLKAAVIQLGGKVTGNISAAGKIILGEKSFLTGDISTPNLVIKEGAKFEGRCDMSSKKEPVKI
ncbi:MAG: polymer-forming cytoskeletal protein [Candidatus Marinimicrobia bacterium]|nr:polymer-forming cytoskeletal protein [Candidatus Neomarinimicrobiota bacterium]